MARRPRITLAGVPLHLIPRGNNLQACFFAEENYRTYLGWPEEYEAKIVVCPLLPPDRQVTATMRQMGKPSPGGKIRK